MEVGILFCDRSDREFEAMVFEEGTVTPRDDLECHASIRLHMKAIRYDSIGKIMLVRRACCIDCVLLFQADNCAWIVDVKAGSKYMERKCFKKRQQYTNTLIYEIKFW